MSKSNKVKEKARGLFADFKAFIKKGDAFMLAVGVVIGGAFNAIVSALVNILTNLATFWVPGGLSGLITILPAVNATQSGVEGIGQQFAATDYNEIVKLMAGAMEIDTSSTAGYYAVASSALNSKYTLRGGTYIFNGAAYLDWGAFINAFIGFLVVALTLFVIVKVIKGIEKKNAEIKAKMLEDYYVKHPEERPIPSDPQAPVPATIDVLLEIRDQLKLLNGRSDVSSKDAN